MKSVLCGLAAVAAMAMPVAAAAGPVDDAVDALGGPALSQLRTARIEGAAKFFDPGQSGVPGEGALLGAEGTFVQRREFGSGDVRTDWSKTAFFPTPHPHVYVEILAGPVGYVKGPDSFLPTKAARETGEHRMSTMRVTAMRRELERTSPRLLLDMQAHPDRVQALKPQVIEGRASPAVLYRSPHGAFTVAFDPTTHLPLRIRTLDYDPLEGDQDFELAFGDWRTVDGMKYPFRQTYRIGGRLVSETAISAFKANASVAAGVFAVPDDIRSQPAGTPPKAVPYQLILRKLGFNVFLDSDTIGWDPALPPPALTELGPGVLFLSGGGYNNLVVELKDHLVVYDAGLEEQSRSLLDQLKARFPDKPVRYLVLTHHHFDHAGGLRSFVADGATVVVGKGGGAYIRRILSHPHTLAGVALPERLPPRVVEVEGRWSTSDGERRAEAYAVASEHADNLMIGYVPHLKLGFVSDLWAPGRQPVPTPLTRPFRELADAVKTWGLEPERFAGGHGAVGAYAPLAAAAE